jgi:hypothetical protein
MTTLRIANYSAVPFTGSLLTTTDHWPEGETPTVLRWKNAAVEPVRELSPGLWQIEVVVYREPVAPGAVAPFEFADAEKDADVPDAVYPTSPATPKVEGVALTLVGSHTGMIGGAFTSHHRRRFKMLVVDVYQEVSVDGFVRGVVTAALEDTDFDWPYVEGDELVVTLEGLTMYEPVTLAPFRMPLGRMADGQMRSMPFVAIDATILTGGDAPSILAVAQGLVHAQALNELWPGMGWPEFRGDKLKWINKHTKPTLAALHGWGTAGVGVTPKSSQTGPQEDLVFVGGESKDVPGGHLPRYFAALGQSRRPCHFFEADGSPLSPDRENLCIWYGRPFHQWGDKLGRVRSLGEREAQGWSGPDEEHLFLNSLFVAYRQTGCQAIQAQIRNQAVQWLYYVVTDPKHPLSRPGAARAVGWKGWAAWIFWHSLEDRQLAQRIAERWVEYVDKVLVPKLDPAKPWHTFAQPKWGTGKYWFPYQQAIGAWGVYMASRLFGSNAGCFLAFGGAMLAVKHGYDADNGTTYEGCREDFGEHIKGASEYHDYGLPLALAVVRYSSFVLNLYQELWDHHLSVASGKWTDRGAL